MSLSTSNTYITPTNTTGIGIARGQINGSLRAISQNFYSKAAPVSTNISDDGTLVDPYPGTLYFSSNSFALYRMSESTVSGGYYSTQKFTRRGVSYRTEIDSTSATANITSGYETGEMYFRLSDDTYWFRNSTGTAVQFQTGAAASIGDGTVTPIKLAAASYIQYNTSGQLALNNAIATSATVRSDAILSIRNAATQFPNPSLFIEPSSHGTSRHARIDIDNWSIRQDYQGSGTKDLGIVDKAAGSLRLYLDTSGNIGIGTNSPSTKLDVNGSININGTLTMSGGGIYTGSGVSTGDVTIELGGNRTGNGNAYLDLHAVSGTDFETRFLRNGGVNGTCSIYNTGTGLFDITQLGAGALSFGTNSSERMRITSAGNVGIGTNSPGQKLTVAGTIESTSGGFKFPDGTTQTTATSSPTPNTEIFTTTTTWTCPTGVNKIYIMCVGGGGGGGASGGETAGGYGGLGGFGYSLISVSPGTTYTVTIGAGGLGISYGSYGNGTSGSESWFGVNSSTKLISATGGGGGIYDGNPGSPGTSTGNIYARLHTYFGGPLYGFPYGGDNIRTATTWSTSKNYSAGAGGTGFVSYALGGVGGAILIQYHT